MLGSWTIQSYVFIISPTYVYLRNSVHIVIRSKNRFYRKSSHLLRNKFVFNFDVTGLM
jgi:hypothetical protein